MDKSHLERRADNWIQTYSGIQFWPFNALPEEVEIIDIAHGLSNMCRYNGHCQKFYSVAEHSVIVSNIVPAEHALWGLLHDASEAYLADITRPVKKMLKDYCEAEDRLMAVIAEKFGLPPEMPECVKKADVIALATERRDLMSDPPVPWRATANITPLPGKIVPLSPTDARGWFMQRFDELMIARSRRAA